MNVDNISTENQWLDRFFDHYYRVNPVSATFIGVHAHDNDLPRFQESGVNDVDRSAQALLDELESIGLQRPDDVASEIDLLLARSYLRVAQAERQSEHLIRNPCLYTGEAIFGIVSLFLRDFAPLDQRLDSAAARLVQIPDLLHAGIQSITTAPDACVERAVSECDGAARLLSEGLPALLARHAAPRPDVLAARDVALDAFADFRQRLVTRSAAKTRGPYGIGQERFDWLLREAHFLDMTGNEIAAYARRELEIARVALERELAEQGYPGWDAVADAIADQHPAADEYLNRFQDVWDVARQHTIDRELLTWPDVPIIFEPIPDWARSAAPHLYFLYYRCPPPHPDGQIQRYRVPPLSEPPERTLRAVNETQITLNHVIHHAGLGHHVQNWHAARARSRVARMAGNDCALRIAMSSAGTLVEGWACYATDLMEESGFLTALQQLSMRHSRMRMAARAIVDVELHAGRFSLDDAIAFYVDEVGMSPEAARGEAVKNSMFPTMAMMYLIGTDLIHDLRTEMEQRWGASFSLRRFHDEFLSWGAIPVTLIANVLRGEAPGPGGFNAAIRDRWTQAASQD